MRFRMGLMLGFGAGYVLGAKAGRERYEQMRDVAGRVWQSEQGQKIKDQAREAVEMVERQATNRIRLLRRHDAEIDLTGIENGARVGGPI